MKELPKVRLNSYLPKLPDEVEVEVFVSEEALQRMRKVKDGWMLKIIAINERGNL